MARTIIGLGDAKAVKRYSVALAEETFKQSFFGRNFFDKNGNNVVHEIDELERQSGDQVSCDLFTQLTGAGTKGSDNLKGNEEALVAYSQNVWIDQLRHGVNLGSKIDRKRTIWDLRDIAMGKLANWWARRLDEEKIVYLTGDRGDETGDWLLSTDDVPAAGNAWVGNNTITAQNAANKLYVDPDNNTGVNTIANSSDDYVSVDFLEYIIFQMRIMKDAPPPIITDKGERWVLLMHSVGEYQLRTSATWKAILQSTEKGQDKIFGEALGTYGPLILYSHPKVVRKNEGASSAAVAHNLLMGAQALLFLKGDATGDEQEFEWHEETDDRGDKPVVDTGMIRGMNRSIYNSKSYSTVTCYTTGGAAVS